MQCFLNLIFPGFQPEEWVKRNTSCCSLVSRSALLSDFFLCQQQSAQIEFEVTFTIIIIIYSLQSTEIVGWTKTQNFFVILVVFLIYNIIFVKHNNVNKTCYRITFRYSILCLQFLNHLQQCFCVLVSLTNMICCIPVYNICEYLLRDDYLLHLSDTSAEILGEVAKYINSYSLQQYTKKGA